MWLEKIQKFFGGRSPKERAGIYIALVILLAAFSDRVLLNPIVSRLKRLDENINAQESLVKKSVHILAQKDGRLKEIAQFENFLVETHSEEEGIATFLKEVESIASKTSVYVVDMKSRGVITDGDTVKYVVDLNCEAGMEQIVKFMYLVELSDSLLKVVKYNLIPKSKDSSMIKATLSIHKFSSQSEA